MRADSGHDHFGTTQAAAPIVWASRALGDIVRLAAQIGTTDAKVLIGGESGVGKDVVARLLHERSLRARRPLVTLNCAAIPDSLLESELFGHEKGSFTDAYRENVGQLRQAHQGTLFLDEVGEMSPRMQALMLRFLENGEVQPIGRGSLTCVDVRVLAATNQNLDARVANGQFRGDLLYRLRVVHVFVPPLRERPEDVPPLVDHFLSQLGRRVSVSPAAMDLLAAYRWPGNVRELRNVVEHIVVLSKGEVILPEHLPASLSARRERPDAERRRQVADDLHQALSAGQCSFWDDVHAPFLMRDITRRDIRELVSRGLAAVRGNYHALLTLWGLPQHDYKRFLNFLTTHDCNVDFRPFRSAEYEDAPRRAPRLLPHARGADAPEPRPHPQP